MNKHQNKIEILCPPRKCKKCTRIIKGLEDILNEEKIDAEIIILNKLEDLIGRGTWILPTIIANGKVVARGYIPDKQSVLKEMY